MQFYKLHIGDYMRDTAHLTLVEEGIYRRLLDWYYSNERPLPNDFDRICRLVRAEESEKPQVKSVLSEFFKVSDDGYSHTRCDRELREWYAKSDKARESALTRWSERNANGMRTHSEGNATHYPLPTTHYPEITTLSGKPDVNPQKEKNLEAKEAAKRVLSFLNEKTGRAYRAVPANLDLIAARLREGATEQDCKSVIAKKTREWLKDEKMVTYLRPETLFGARKFAQYVGELV